MRVLVVARRQLLDARAGETREIVGRAPQRRECRPPRFVWQRDAHLGARGERFEQCPLGAGQILEAVREDRLRLPRAEVGLESFGGAAAEEVSIPEAEPVERSAIRRVERCEVAFELRRVEQAGLELAERL